VQTNPRRDLPRKSAGFDPLSRRCAAVCTRPLAAAATEDEGSKQGRIRAHVARLRLGIRAHAWHRRAAARAGANGKCRIAACSRSHTGCKGSLTPRITGGKLPLQNDRVPRLFAALRWRCLVPTRGRAFATAATASDSATTQCRSQRMSWTLCMPFQVSTKQPPPIHSPYLQLSLTRAS
jgi:hypothetical protein